MPAAIRVWQARMESSNVVGFVFRLIAVVVGLVFWLIVVVLDLIFQAQHSAARRVPCSMRSLLVLVTRFMLGLPSLEPDFPMEVLPESVGVNSRWYRGTNTRVDIRKSMSSIWQETIIEDGSPPAC